MGAFRLLSLFGEAPEAVPGAAGDALAATGEVDADATVGLGGTEGATIGFGAVVGETFSGAWAVNAGELIGVVGCFSNCRATLLSFPRSRAGVGEPDVAVLSAVAVGCGSTRSPRVEGVVAGGKVALAPGASVNSGGDVGGDVVVVGGAMARGVNVRCGIGVEVWVTGAADVGAGVAVELAACVAVGVVDAVVAIAAPVSVARTKLFGGASCGGVASDLIFARTCSASR